MQMNKPSLPGALKFLLSFLFILLLVTVFFVLRWYENQGFRSRRLLAWLRHPERHPQWKITAGTQCQDAPFMFPTDGYIGFLWGDSFRPGHTHQGIDIFTSESSGATPVMAAYSGYLTRLEGWTSSLIIRIPQDPLHPDRQIWTYYTHLADEDGKTYISQSFPPGTSETYVQSGTILGYQGNYSGQPGNPVGTHLHFSIVKDDGQGRFRNELRIENTLDPSPYFGMPLNAKHIGKEIPACPPSARTTP